MTYLELIAEQDKQRTQRNFISFLGGAFGLDQAMAYDDASVYNAPGGYQVMAPYGVGGVGIEGKPISNVQGSVTTGGLSLTWPMLLLLGGGAWLLMNKG